MRGAQAQVHETLHDKVEFFLEAKIAPKVQGNHLIVVFSQGGWWRSASGDG